MDWHSLFITLHATFATLCLLTGLVVVWPAFARRYPWLFGVFFVSLIGLVVFMVSATASHWTDIDVAARVSFSALAFLGVYMIYRGVRAKNKRTHVKQSDGYIDDIGFVIIALFVGLLIVPLIRMGVQVWLGVLAVGSIIFIGNLSVRLLHARNAKT